MSAAGNKDRQRGLTLVEMLVVLGVIALVGGIVITTLPERTSDAERMAREFERQVTALSDRAVTGGVSIGIASTEDGGLTLHSYRDGWKTEGAMAVPAGVRAEITPADDVIAPDPEPTGTLIVYRAPGEEPDPPAPAPPVLFGGTGEVTPFVARFADGGDAWLVTVGPFGEAVASREE